MKKLILKALELKIKRIVDVTVSSIGDAKSLRGGTLLLAPLRGADGKVYAMAQGTISHYVTPTDDFVTNWMSGSHRLQEHVVQTRIPKSRSAM